MLDDSRYCSNSQTASACLCGSIISGHRLQQPETWTQSQTSVHCCTMEGQRFWYVRDATQKRTRMQHRADMNAITGN